MHNNSLPPHLPRRRLIGAMGAGAAALALSGLSGSRLALADSSSDDRARALLRRETVVDFHTHMGLWQTIGLGETDRSLGGIDELKLASNVQEVLEAGCNCVYLDTVSDIARTRIGRPGNKDRDFVEDEAWEDYLRQYALIQGFLTTLPISIAETPGQVAEIARRGELAVVLSTEGGHMLERDPERIDQLYEHGLRRLQPIHYVASTLGDSQTDPPRYGGLSDLGKRVLRRADELGMMIDMAHASLESVQQTVELVDKPIVLSHTMVAYESERYGDYRATRSRWITPEHARIIADTGGIIGTFPVFAPYGVDTLDAFVEALKVMVDTVGIDHVGWSTDLVEAGRPEFLKDYRDIAKLCARLLDDGFSESDVAKFMGGNALRVQAAV